MREIEIPCLIFKDLKVTVPADPSPTDLLIAKSQALNVVYECNKRTFGDDCAWRCALPAVALSEPDKIRGAIQQAVGNSGLLDRASREKGLLEKILARLGRG